MDLGFRNIVLITFLLFLSFGTSLGQDFTQLIPDRKFTQYKLPDSLGRGISFNMLSDKQVGVAIGQGVYNPNLALWKIYPGSSITSFVKVYTDEFYLKANSNRTKLNLLKTDSVKGIKKVGEIDFGLFNMKKVVNSNQVIIYGKVGDSTFFYSFVGGELKKQTSFKGYVSDLVATTKQTLFVSDTKLYGIKNNKISLLKDFSIKLTGISYGPSKSFFISTIGGVLWFPSWDVKKPIQVTKLINGMTHYQANNLFVLDLISNSIFRIDFKEK